LTAVMLGELLIEAGLPAELLAVLHDASGEAAQMLLAEPRIGFYTFTGSTRVGRIIQQAAGLRRTQLELGSIASTIICQDADLDTALPKVVNAAFRKAGQVCTSVQRIYIHRAIWADAIERLSALTSAMTAGDPRAAATRVGPMISIAAADRVARLLDEAVDGGAAIRVGGKRASAVFSPTLVTGTSPGMAIVEQEVFGPILSAVPFESLDEAFDATNATPYGLAIGLFTRDLATALAAARRLRFGAVHINETSSARADAMPFGGVKDSGFGREGPGFAIREYTEDRLITIRA
jgi:acyl-CoA reductase-like NAD-dependent aldehyde dehydrogenase